MAEEEFSAYLKRRPWDVLLNKIGKKIPRKYWLLSKSIYAIFLFFILFVPCLNILFQTIINGKNVLGWSSQESVEKVDAKSLFIPVATPIDIEGHIEKRVYDEKSEKKCHGAVFDIVKDFQVEGSLEKLNILDPDDPEKVSAEGTKNYQGSYQSSFECDLPFVATFSATPQEGTKSMGLFFEFRDVFKVIVGDGDMKAVKIQVNNAGDRGEWGVFLRKYLSKELEIGKEVLVTVKAMSVGQMVVVEAIVNNPKFDDLQVFTTQRVSVSTNVSLPRKFRVGINDYKYKGMGSVLRLNSFSVLESKWD